MFCIYFRYLKLHPKRIDEFLTNDSNQTVTSVIFNPVKKEDKIPEHKDVLELVKNLATKFRHLSPKPLEKDKKGKKSRMFSIHYNKYVTTHAVSNLNCGDDSNVKMDIQ